MVRTDAPAVGGESTSVDDPQVRPLRADARRNESAGRTSGGTTRATS